MLHFEGCTHFRQRIILSTLSGRPIEITNIREDDDIDIGLQGFEANFLRLIEKLTNGCSIQINETGTTLIYEPGIITGGVEDDEYNHDYIEHDCGLEKNITWFLEGILPMAYFSKNSFQLTLYGITNDINDISIDSFQTSTSKLLTYFLNEIGVDNGFQLNIKKRGCYPNGGGIVKFSCPIIKSLNSINLLDGGLIRRIRGISWTAKTSAQVSNRMAHTIRNIYDSFLSDVYISTDHHGNRTGGNSPGFGVSLVAETTTDCIYTIDVTATEGTIPEDLAQEAAMLMMEEIQNGGCIDSTNQSLALILMAISPEEVSRIRLGTLTQYTIETLRNIRNFFGVIFKIKPDNNTKTLVLSCLGVGYKNLAKKVT